MVDTHAHLGVCEPPDGELVDAARAAGVERVLTVGLDEGSNRAAIRAARDHDAVFACVGRHPNSAAGFDDEAAVDIEQLAADEAVRAVGETGFDYYREGADRDSQRAAFEAQLEIARRAGLPLVIHVRDSAPGADDAVADAFALLRERAAGVPVVLHCFSAPPGRVAEAAERGWFCSFAGNVTYPRSQELREAAALVPDELLLAETDAPYLAPQERRGKPNQPAYVVATAGRLAELRGTTYEDIERIIAENAARVFRW